MLKGYPDKSKSFTFEPSVLTPRMIDWWFKIDKYEPNSYFQLDENSKGAYVVRYYPDTKIISFRASSGIDDTGTDITSAASPDNR